MDYLGEIFCTSLFSRKNKINLLKYLLTNLNLLIQGKDATNKNLKILPFLLLAIKIIKKIKAANTMTKQ